MITESGLYQIPLAEYVKDPAPKPSLKIQTHCVRSNRRFVVEPPRPCKECKQIFQPRRQDVRNGRGFYCSPRCAKIGTGKDARHSYEEDVALFWSRVKRTTNPSDCWIFTGPCTPYGRQHFQGRNEFTHRLAYKLTNGPIPEGHAVCHSCDNPPCCNPSHLFTGTIADNNADMKRKDRHARGERNWFTRLTEEIVKKIREDQRSGVEIARSYGVSKALVSMIRNRKVWAHVAD